MLELGSHRETSRELVLKTSKAALDCTVGSEPLNLPALWCCGGSTGEFKNELAKSMDIRISGDLAFHKGDQCIYSHRTASCPYQISLNMFLQNNTSLDVTSFSLAQAYVRFDVSQTAAMCHISYHNLETEYKIANMFLNTTFCTER